MRELTQIEKSLFNLINSADSKKEDKISLLFDAHRTLIEVGVPTQITPTTAIQKVNKISEPLLYAAIIYGSPDVIRIISINCAALLCSDKSDYEKIHEFMNKGFHATLIYTEDYALRTRRDVPEITPLQIALIKDQQPSEDQSRNIITTILLGSNPDQAFDDLPKNMKTHITSSPIYKVFKYIELVCNSPNNAMKLKTLRKLNKALDIAPIFLFAWLDGMVQDIVRHSLVSSNDSVLLFNVCPALTLKPKALKTVIDYIYQTIAHLEQSILDWFNERLTDVVTQFFSLKTFPSDVFESEDEMKLFVMKYINQNSSLAKTISSMTPTTSQQDIHKTYSAQNPALFSVTCQDVAVQTKDTEEYESHVNNLS